MSEIRTAKDLMVAQSIRVYEPVDLIASRIVARNVLSGKTKFSFCPYCVERVKRSGLDYKEELKPLHLVTYKELIRYEQTKGLVQFNEYYECQKCRTDDGKPRRITYEDWEKFYCIQPKEDTAKRIIDLSNTEEVEEFYR